MPTVAEILKSTGLTDEQIAALDPKATAAFTQVLTTATQEHEAAELTKRATAEKFDTEISPALDRWANEKASYDAKIAAYEAAMKSAKEGGFNVPDILAVKPAPVQGPDGKFVANTNTVPGSPGFEKKVIDQIGGAFSFSADTQWRYRSLFGREMPDSPTTLIAEANAQHMTPQAYAEKKYGFTAKEQEIQAKARQDEIDKAVKDAEARKDKEWGEKVGSNPDLRRVEVSRFSEINKAVKAGTRPDPLAPGLSEAQRDANTRSAIKAELATQTVQ